MRCAEDPTDKRLDLAKMLREDLSDNRRGGYEVVAFTHLENDHICGTRESSWFQYAANRAY
jgi:hypothetical protein